MTKRLVTLEGLWDRGIPYSKVQLVVMMRSGTFPKALQLSPKKIAWDLDQVLEWIRSRPVANVLDPEAPPYRPCRPGSRPRGRPRKQAVEAEGQVEAAG
jgi:hypothetical protein